MFIIIIISPVSSETVYAEQGAAVVAKCTVPVELTYLSTITTDNVLVSTDPDFADGTQIKNGMYIYYIYNIIITKRCYYILMRC